MATKRRGGFRPPELRGTLGTLLKTAIQQAGGVRDALERGARQGRSKLDELRTDRKRHDILAELGELVLDLIRRGEIDLGELPEARDLIRDLDELDAATESEDPSDITSTQPFERRAPSRPGSDDGTVGSGARWSPPAAKPGSRAESSASARVWRPPADEPAEDKPASRPALTLPKDPHRKGGISFEDDDLADYMHPDDVPAKDPSGGDA